jgi:hypothetical protein
MLRRTLIPQPLLPQEKGAKPYYFLVPLSCGRGARGEGFTGFYLTSVKISYLAIAFFDEWLNNAPNLIDICKGVLIS